LTGQGKKPRRSTRPLELWAGRAFTQGLAWSIRRLPYSWLGAPGRLLGSLCYAAMPRYRRVAHANLRRAYGDAWSDAEVAAVAKRSFQHLGMTLVEALWMPRLTGEALRRTVRLEGAEHLDRALEGGHGAILISAHYGNWEIMAPRLTDEGYRISTIARDADDPGVNRILNDIRRGAGQQILPRASATRPALACLRRNEILALLLDQNTLKGGVFVPFFGLPAATAAGPATLALRTGAPLVPIFCTRQPDRSHVARILPPIRPETTGDTPADILRLTTAITAAIETQIRACPEQWLWIHNRWKLRPDGSRLE